MEKILSFFVFSLLLMSCEKDITNLSINPSSNISTASLENGPINDLAALPDLVLQYVFNNYPEQQISAASRNENGFEVALTGGDQLIFDLNGAFLFAEEVETETIVLGSHLGYTEVENIDELPDPIRQYLVYNYADVRIDLALKNNQGYKVILATALELNFGIEGNFLFYDDGGN